MRVLRWSVFTAAWLALMTGLVSVGILTCNSLETDARQRLHRDLQTQALLFREQLGPRLDGESAAALQEQCESFSNLTGNRVAIVLPSGRVLCDSHSPPAAAIADVQGPEVQAALAGITRTSLESQPSVDVHEVSLAVPVLRNSVVVGVVRASMPPQVVEAKLNGVRHRVALAGLVLGGLATGIMLSLNHRVRQPLELMRRTAERLAREDLAGGLRLPPSTEMSSLAGALDQMADQLEQRIGLFSRQGSEQEAVLASMVEGVLAVDTDERVISLNSAAAALLGTNPDNAKGRGLQEVIRNADLRRFVSRSLASDRPVEDDVVLRSDEERILQARGTSLRDGRGRTVGAVIVLNDVTHLRRLENIRRDFVANVSHELKTPITSIKGFVETLLDGALHSPEDSQRFLRIVAKQADRLNAIIEDLLCLAKIEQADTAANVVLQQCRLRDVLQAALDECGPKAAERHIAVRLAGDAELLAEVSPALLEQAVMNLLDNAIKYSEAESEVVVETACLPEEILIHVRDQGCGIEEEHLDRLFERFYRVDKARSRKLGGTGLGLSIVKHIVNVHGGKVTVESSPGQGSTFTIHLPR
jgi:two-component system phosphate regulon sensor histidine kinase PhoR